MVYPRSIKTAADKVTKLKMEEVLAYAKSIMEEDDELFDVAGEYIHEKYPRGCEVLYGGGKMFVGGSPRDIAIALTWMKLGIDERMKKGVSKNKKARLRYTEAERKQMALRRPKKLKKHRSNNS